MDYMSGPSKDSLRNIEIAHFADENFAKFSYVSAIFGDDVTPPTLGLNNADDEERDIQWGTGCLPLNLIGTRSLLKLLIELGLQTHCQYS